MVHNFNLSAQEAKLVYSRSLEFKAGLFYIAQPRLHSETLSSLFLCFIIKDLFSWAVEYTFFKLAASAKNYTK